MLISNGLFVPGIDLFKKSVLGKLVIKSVPGM